jgi:hypothetical protein
MFIKRFKIVFNVRYHAFLHTMPPLVNTWAPWWAPWYNVGYLVPQGSIVLHVEYYPPSFVARLRLQPFLKLDRHGKSFVILRIDKTLYGLKEAGKLSNLRLVQLLSSYNFVETSTPCLILPSQDPYHHLLPCCG